MSRRFLWTEEEIIKWINKNELDGFIFIKIIELKGIYSRLLFICPKCKKEYEVCFKNFKNGQRCGCDKGKRNHTYQDVLDICKKKNLIVLDNDGIYSYKKKFKLMCSNGHIFYMTLTDLLRGHSCPYCSKNAKLTYEYIVEYFLFYGYKVLSDKYVNANTKLLIECPEGHIYKVTYSDFYRGRRCPYCKNNSKGEIFIKEILNKYSIKYKCQYRFDNCKYKKPLPFDFYISSLNLCIEYDGIGHFEPVDFAGKGKEWAEENFEITKKHDDIKNQYCKDNDIKLIRIPYWEFDNIENIICQELNIDKYE